MYSTAKLIDMVGDVMIWNEERNAQTQRKRFSRLARGLISSLPGFGAAKSSSNSSLSALSEEKTGQVSGPDTTFAAYSVQSENNQDLSPIDSNNVKDVRRMPFPALQESFVEQNRQRLVGRTGRIHLEAPATLEPPSPLVKQIISETPRGILDVSSLSSLSTALGRTEMASPLARQIISETPREILDIPLPPSLPTAPSKTETNMGIPVGRPEPAKPEVGSSHPRGVNKTVVGDQRRLPFKGNVRIVTRNPLCGSGEFSCGQSEAVIKNPAVRASSVVVVTLTSNPGPVAVHYVSLLPYESFTVHLTAPTAMHTRFNYLIFSGELT